jgi:hypothetical protein
MDALSRDVLRIGCYWQTAIPLLLDGGSSGGPGNTQKVRLGRFGVGYGFAEQIRTPDASPGGQILFSEAENHSTVASAMIWDGGKSGFVSKEYTAGLEMLCPGGACSN